MPALPRPEPADALELPELETSDDTREVDVGAFQLDLVDSEELDEDAGHVESFQVEIEVLTDSGGDEPVSELDIGVSHLLNELPENQPPDEDPQPVASSDDLDFGLDEPLESDEPSSTAELGDDGLEALPELSRDDSDADGPDEQALLPAAPEGDLPEGAAYDSEWLLIGSAASALGGGPRGVVAAGDHVMCFGPERKSYSLPAGARVTSVCQLDSGRIVAASTRGLLELGSGDHFTPLDAPEAARGRAGDLVALGVGKGQSSLWARLSGGALLRRRTGVWERHETGGEVRSLSVDQDAITLLVIAERPTLQLSTDAGSSFHELLLPEPAATVALGPNPLALSRGRLIALSDPARGLCLSDDAGTTFRMVTGAVNVTALAIGEHAGAPSVFAALHREGRDVSSIIVVDPSSGSAVAIAELAADPDDDAEELGRTSALLFHDGALWCAGGYGLVKLSR